MNPKINHIKEEIKRAELFDTAEIADVQAMADESRASILPGNQNSLFNRERFRRESVLNKILQLLK